MVPLHSVFRKHAMEFFSVSHLLMEKCLHPLASQFLTSWGGNLEGACTTGLWGASTWKVEPFLYFFLNISLLGVPRCHPRCSDWFTRSAHKAQRIVMAVISHRQRRRGPGDVREKPSTSFRSPLPGKSHRKHCVPTAMTGDNCEMVPTKEVS